MAIQARVYTVDDVWRLEQQPINPAEKYYLIDGELCIKMSPSRMHGRLALRIGRFIANYADEHNLGETAVEAGYHPPDDRRTLLLPDVSFEGRARAAQPPLEKYAPFMPDLAVEIISPSQTLEETRRKAEVYLRHGTAMVWLVRPVEKQAEVWTAADDGAPQNETIDLDGELSGGTVLPGFTLPLERLFPV